MIDQATIDRIIDAARIEEVVSDYVTLKRRGVNMLGLCPFHNEKTPSFTVSPAKGIFKCFGCGKGGNSVHFVMEHDQLSYYEALKYLAKKYHIEVVERELTPEQRASQNNRESMLLVNEFAQKHFSNNLVNHIEGKSIALSYLRKRAFRDDIIKKFQVGYSLSERDNFTKEAIKAGYNKEFLVKTGLSLEHDNDRLSDRFRGRVMFPIHSLSGKVIAFGGRILKKDEKTAKYLNSPESEIYHKSNELYGIYFAKQAIVREDRCFLVEGYTDVISMHQTGIENVVASSGTALTPGQIRMIHRFSENITLIYDGDAAGIKASVRGIDLLLEEGLNIKVVLLPEGEDPDSFAQKTNADEFIKYIKENSDDFIRFKTKLLIEDAGNDPVKRAGLIRDIVKSISVIPNQIIRAEYVRECGNLLSIDEKILYNEINKIKGENQQKLQTKQAFEKRAASQQGATPNKKEENLFINTKYELQERNILEFLMRYGKEVLFTATEELPEQTVEEYILEELEIDQIEFHNPLYANILNEYKKRCLEKDFFPERFFLHHPEGEISMLTAELISDKYPLSKIHSKIKMVQPESEQLATLVPRVIYEMKDSILLDKIKLKLLEIKKATETKDQARCDTLLQEISLLYQIKKDLAKELGERIITKL